MCPKCCHLAAACSLSRTRRSCDAGWGGSVAALLLIAPLLLLAPTRSHAAASVVTTIPVGPNNPTSVGANPITNKIYVGVSNSAVVAVIDGSSNTIATNIPIVGGTFLGNLAVNTATNKIYVAVNGGGFGNRVDVINGTTDTVATGIPVGTGPR